MIEPATLAELDEDACRALARSYAGVAKTLALRAAELEARRAMRARVRNDWTALEAAGRDCLALVNAGVSLGHAIDRCSAETGLPGATVAHHMRAARLAQARAERAARDRLILQLARRGWTDAEIERHPAVPIKRRQISNVVRNAIRPALERAGRDPHGNSGDAGSSGAYAAAASSIWTP